MSDVHLVSHRDDGGGRGGCYYFRSIKTVVDKNILKKRNR